MGYVIRRVAARVVCLNPSREVLMIRSSDPVDRSKPNWWELPGGGIDFGETAQDAILRELREECGVRNVEMGPLIWTQHARFTFAGWDFDQYETLYVAHSDGDSSGTTHLEALEAVAFQEMRWRSLEELMTDPLPTVPPRLREFIEPIVAGRYPAEPIDISPLDDLDPDGLGS